MIIETCPRCGAVLYDVMLASNPPIPKKECFSCGWSWTGEPEKIEYRPFGGNGYIGTSHSVLNVEEDNQ